MPSLFSRFRHKKTNSTSDNLTSPSTPGLPSQQQQGSIGNADRHKSLPPPPHSKITSPSTPALARKSVEGNSNSGVPSSGQVMPVPASLKSRSNKDITINPARKAPPPPTPETVVISANADPTLTSVPAALVPAPASATVPAEKPSLGSDPTGHQPPFRDESERPQLPTTTSNVDNPPPHGALDRTHNSAQYQHPTPTPGRALSPLSELRSATPQDLPLPPGAAAASPPPPAALPHVSSIDTSHIKDVESHRPRPVVSESKNRYNSEEGQLGGQFGHVDSLPVHDHGHDHDHDEEDLQGGSSDLEDQGNEGGDFRRATDKGKGRRKSLEVNIPSRGTSLRPELASETSSLHHTHTPPSGPAGVHTPPGRESGADPRQQDTANPRELNRDQDQSRFPNAARRGEISTSDHLASALSNLSFHGPKPIRTHEGYGDPNAFHSHPEIEAQRGDLLGKIVNESQSRNQDTVNEDGKRVFKAAGMEELLEKENTVDVKSRWLKPVIQETILPKEHIEYTTVIERDIHRHHIYPKIQPIQDPDPIILAPRHRIFSPATGKWHEVVGDEAAIAILGEDVFHNGPKEVRHARELALPGFNGEAVKEGHELPRDSFTSETQQGSHYRQANLMDTLTDGFGDDEDLTALGYGTGGKGKVVEREGILGQDLGEWRPVGRGEIFSKKSDNIGVAV